MISRSVSILENIYELYERNIEQFDLACREGCYDCCTCNVTATSLETACLFLRLEQDELADVRRRMETAGTGNRYRPSLTTNGFARATLTGEDVDAEDNDPAWGRCPLLVDGRCSIYRVRPFGCRSMVSQTPCSKNGWADMPPLALTISTVFLQYIEHLDTGGISGNFLDIAGNYAARDTVDYLALENIADFDKKEGFIQNLEVPALMVPPEHRSKIAPLVKALNTLMQKIK